MSNRIRLAFMSLPFRVTVAAAVLIVFGGWLLAQGPATDRGVLEQLQETLKRLQAEVKSLQDTVKRLSNESKKNKGSKQIAAKTIIVEKPPSDGRSALESYKRAREFEDKRLFRPAIEAYSQTIQFDPGSDTAFLRRADCYYRLAEYENAAADYTRSLGLQPDNSRAYLGRASARSALGQIKLALADTNEAIFRNARSADSFILRARLNQLDGETEKGIADYTVAIALSPNSEKALLGRAAALLGSGQVARALADCDGAVRINPNSSAAYLCRAQSYLRMRSTDRAIDELNQALLTAQITSQPLPLLSDLRQSMLPAPSGPSPLTADDQPAATVTPQPQSAATPPAQPPVIIPQPSDQLTTVPNPRTPAFPIASHPLIQGLSKTPARPSTNANAVRTGTENAAYFEKLGRTQSSGENFPEALRALNRAIELDPNMAHAFNARGYVHLRLRHLDEAAADFSEAIRLSPNYVNAYHNRAVVRRMKGDRGGASEDDLSAAELARSES